MAATAEDLKFLIGQALGQVADERITTHIRTCLVEPYIEMRDWDYGEPGQQFPCWIVFIDSAGSGITIAYSEFGFGPNHPWGLLWVEGQGHWPTSMGMDCSWYENFVEAFLDSLAASSLAIWHVIKEDAPGPGIELTDELSWDDAWARCEAFRSGDPSGRYVVDTAERLRLTSAPSM